jgi:hypothetical protein
MFKRRTLFIVGAGASNEVGFPLGRALADDVGQRMDVQIDGRTGAFVGKGDIVFWEYLRDRDRRQLNSYLYAGWLIREGIPFAQSIDDFLDRHRSNEIANTLGKAMIIKAILEAERGGALYFNKLADPEAKFQPGKFANTWLMKFIHVLGRDLKKEDVRTIFDNVAFIVFNYDRCLEFFLIHAISNLYGIADTDAAELVEELTIIHPYGAPGGNTNPLRRTPFGRSGVNYLELSRDIKTFTEQAHTDITQEIAVEVARAEALVFLGFGYHDQNMSILKPEEKQKPKLIYGTAYKMSDSDVDVISHQLADFFMPLNPEQRAERIKIDNKHKSVDLFDYYAKSLAG